jgi:hypothetical protein
VRFVFLAVFVVAASFVGKSAFDYLYRCDQCPVVDRHRHAWDAHDIADYSYRYEISSMVGMFQADVMVRDGHVVQARWLDRPPPYGARFPTIPQLFGDVKHAMHQADAVAVTWDRRFDFPASVGVDENRRVMDDERGFGASRFVPARP